jgi:tetratricopeptide (TPR) repeat protein
MRQPESRYRSSSNRPADGRSRIRIGAITVVAVVLLGGIGAYYAGAFEFLSLRRFDNQEALLELWSNGRYEDLIAKAESVLNSSPLDPAGLVYGGFAYFYAGIGQVENEERVPYMSQSIQLLRKALHLEYAPLRPELHYVLGKAYYHQGSSYYDLVVEHLQRAGDLGYEATDMYEYLALAYADMGDYTAGAASLRRAIERDPSDVLYLTLGEVYADADEYSQAVSALQTAIAMSTDRVLTERARFALGEVFVEAERYEEAVAVYRSVLEENPESADAHYHLGNIYETRGNPEQARYEWREAFRIDPNHAEAIRKLQNN